MIGTVAANFQMQWPTLLQLFLRAALGCFDCRKTREALVVSNQELVRTKAELNVARVVGAALFILLVVVIATKRG